MEDKKGVVKMLLQTRYFGEIEINEEDIINFPDGIPAFEDIKKFVIVENPEKGVPFHWLQGVDEGSLAFVIINPFLLKDDYDIELPKNAIEKLEIQSLEEVALYTIVVVPEDISKMTANLRAPIVINSRTKKGKQVLLEDDRYQAKHYIAEELKNRG